MDTISWSSGSIRWSAQKELYFPTKILNTFLCPHLWKWCWKPFSGMLILFIILIVVVVVVVVYDDTYYWVYWSSDHQFQVYYRVRQLLLQGATAHFITKCTGLLIITKCDSVFYYKERQVLLQSATILLQSVIGITIKKIRQNSLSRKISKNIVLHIG